VTPSMTPAPRPLVSAEDDPLFDADHSRWPSGRERRASITVADVEAIADGTMWAVAMTTQTTVAAAQLRGTTAAQIGPRRVGALYQDRTGARYEVLALVTRPREAAQLLGRDDARWALVVRDIRHPESQPTAIGTAWTDDDHLLREGSTAWTTAA